MVGYHHSNCCQNHSKVVIYCWITAFTFLDMNCLDYHIRASIEGGTNLHVIECIFLDFHTVCSVCMYSTQCARLRNFCICLLVFRSCRICLKTHLQAVQLDQLVTTVRLAIDYLHFKLSCC